MQYCRGTDGGLERWDRETVGGQEEVGNMFMLFNSQMESEVKGRSLSLRGISVLCIAGVWAMSDGLWAVWRDGRKIQNNQIPNSTMNRLTESRKTCAPKTPCVWRSRTAADGHVSEGASRCEGSVKFPTLRCDAARTYGGAPADE